MLSYHNKSYIDGVAYLFRFLMMYTPQLKKIIDPYDWFCGPGSQMCTPIVTMKTEDILPESYILSYERTWSDHISIQSLHVNQSRK